jgi:Uma2 family endonuclease
MSTVAKPRYSFEEYLAIEREREYKSEYFAGEMFAMAGATENHNLVAFNVANVLGRQLKDRPCKAYLSDMRVRIEATGLTTYPDASVVCGPPQFHDAKRDILLNPQVIVEVLSPSTESYDRGKKFEHYRKLDSLRDYVLISQDRRQIECFTRQPDGRWTLHEASEPGSSLRLASIECDLPANEIYAKIEFD